MLFRYKSKDKILFYFAISLIVFGSINITMDKLALAQNSDSINNTSQANQSIPVHENKLVDTIFENLLTQILPLVGGLVAIGTQFARKQGLKISADAEEYFVKSAQSFVANQSRLMYKEIRNNPDYAIALAQGRMPKEIGKQALENVKNQFLVEIQSDELTKTARKMLHDNLDALVERSVTQNNKEIGEKTKNMLNELIPVAVSAALLQFKTKEDAQKETDGIIQDVLKTVAKNFDYESILFSNEVAEMHIKSELNKRIGEIQ